MLNEFVNKWMVQVFCIWIAGACNSHCLTKNSTEETKDCLVNYFKVEDKCKECPIGYFGYNCSQKCTPPTYGVLCSKECINCSPCHHEVGCNLTPEFTRLDRNITTELVSKNCLINEYKDGNNCKECPAGYFGLNCSQTCVLPSYGIACSERCNTSCLLCHHIKGCISFSELTASDVIVETGKKPSSAGNRIFQTHVNLIILLIGGTITIVLLVVIVFTIRSPRSLVKSNRSDHPSPNVHGIENIYYEFNVVE
ncbi:multiple epidermal growth factor-like domains protein 10 [Crassostrea angulata]|uniref:multiple epidermal growth factor-like domains protein 10 n=1 Tax=Magallana angulata TaxID=2784310 RepID=UPI0022B20A3F|nr:multiple epidermal growth factor-like domains protein 10 [Crassostrea angulata]